MIRRLLHISSRRKERTKRVAFLMGTFVELTLSKRGNPLFCSEVSLRKKREHGHARTADLLATDPIDNLRKDLKYMTFGMMNGFTSQFSALANGIYLAKLSDRIPILPPFAWAAHEDRKEAGYLSFSKVFDVTYLETMLRHPIQEWSNLKITAEDTSGLNESKNPQFENDKLRASALSKVKREKLSCWSLWASQMPDVGKPAGSAVQNHLGLDINYWEVPLSFSHPPKE